MAEGSAAIKEKQENRKYDIHGLDFASESPEAESESATIDMHEVEQSDSTEPRVTRIHGDDHDVMRQCGTCRGAGSRKPPRSGWAPGTEGFHGLGDVDGGTAHVADFTAFSQSKREESLGSVNINGSRRASTSASATL